MHKKRALINKYLRFFSGVLPLIFWCLVIFSFEEPISASASLICVCLHEGGHLFYLSFFAGGKHRLKSVMHGFKIESRALLSYNERILTYLSGPLANLLSGIVFLFLSPTLGEYFDVLATMSFATAFSNLLPIEGYDGYGIITSIIEKREMGSQALRFINNLSMLFVFALCILSLYLIDRYGGGYWIFAIFFYYMVTHFDRTLS